MLFTFLPAVFLLLGAALCAPEHIQNEPNADEHSQTSEQIDGEQTHIAPLAKRSPHYDFGLGKRAYSYVSEYKRLPVYNFGLGKRSRPYSFGLGKRSVDENSQANDDDFLNDVDQENLADLWDQYDTGYDVKRARPYSFGLGKRFAEDDASDEKRAKMYSFGLGKRAPLYNFGLGKRGKNYDFGLGKRLSSKFNFGLGKRQRDSHRFSFGLGKRSDESINDEDSYETEA